MHMRWRRLLAYAALIGTLEAEEDLRWLMLLHPKDSNDLAKSLRKAAGLQHQPGNRGTVEDFLRNPSLATNVHVLSPEEFAKIGQPETAKTPETPETPPAVA